MPLYDLECPECQTVSEHFMTTDDKWLLVRCPECCHGLQRGHHKKYADMRLQIQGDTVSGGCNYNYYDEHLDCQITSKQHRADEMRKQGVRDYSPDPEMQRHRDEQKYIKNNSKPGDANAVKAIQKEKTAATRKRQEAAIDRAFDKAPLPALPEL